MKLTPERIHWALSQTKGNWQDAAALLQVGIAKFRNRIRKLRKEGHDIPGPRGHINRAESAYKPTRKEIRAACEAIRAEWSIAERLSRRVTKDQPWEPPFVEAPGEPREEIW